MPRRRPRRPRSRRTRPSRSPVPNSSLESACLQLPLFPLTCVAERVGLLFCAPVVFSEARVHAPPQSACYTAGVYARKLEVDVVIGGERRPCPLEWLHDFCMRNFTNAAQFDNNLAKGESPVPLRFPVRPR